LFEAFRIHAQIVMTNSAAELESSAKNAISQGRRVLFAMGGDGTFQALANAAFGADALLGILPIGGGNDFAAALALPDDPVKAAVLNSPTYEAGLRLGTGATLDDASLHVGLIDDIGTLGVLRLLPRLMGSGELRTSRVIRWRAQHVRLTTDRPCMFHGDGEILGPTPVEIEVVPKAVRVWAPVRPKAFAPGRRRRTTAYFL